MKILMVGDVVGRPGRVALKTLLPKIQQQLDIQYTVVNVENAAGGFGITEKVLGEFKAMDVQVFTTGNHVWDKQEALNLVDSEPRLLRPHNYPEAAPGSGWFCEQAKNGVRIGVLNIMGQAGIFPALDSPFFCADHVLEQYRSQVDILLVDFHAEMTSEKMAMGWYLDGRVEAVVGTHTHVPTADERILSQGTAYISDLGMTGCYDSVIGSDIDCVLKRMVHKMPSRLDPAKGPGTVCGVVIEFDSNNNPVNIERIMEKADAS